MKFDCGLTAVEKAHRKEEAMKQWHPYFCWWPRRVASHDCRWLEWIERKGARHIGYDHYYWSWEYRPICRLKSQCECDERSTDPCPHQG